MARKSPMAVNKSQTPLWMRVVIIIVAVSFVLTGVVVIVAGMGGGSGNTSGTNDQTGTSSALFAESYQPRVDAAMIAMESNPTNPEIVAQVGHAYYEWAVAVYESGQVSASIPFWLSAVSYYDKVLAIDSSNDIVLGNKAFALYYAQSADAPAALRAFIDGAADNAALAEQVTNAEGMLAEFGTTGSASEVPTTTP